MAITNKDVCFPDLPKRVHFALVTAALWARFDEELRYSTDEEVFTAWRKFLRESGRPLSTEPNDKNIAIFKTWLASPSKKAAKAKR